MPILPTIKHWFQKRFAALGWSAVASEQRAKYNALMGADPDRLVAAITAFDAGSLGTLARMIEAYELRDDKMKTGSMKMKAAVARCDWSVMPLDGYEKDARAARHAECLKRFWGGVRATDAFKRNERGGFALLAKQMMDAQSYGFAVHELVWRPLPSGELGCTFVKVPLWHFENHTGELRFLARANDYEGAPMRDGEWLVSTGDGVGIAAALCACIKRMSLSDWLVFSERCGMPLLHGTTGASFGSEQWNNLNAALAAIGRDTRILTDLNSKVEAIPLGGGASTPFPPLVEWADRAIAALYRGADLSTMSRGDDAVGASVQEGETSLLEQDACNRLSDALHEQIDRFVVRYVFGDDEPLARIWLEPVSKPDVDMDIKVDAHLAGLGVKLSKREALQRYGRTEAADENDALTPPPQGFGDGTSPSFANERPAARLQTALPPFKTASNKPDAQGEGQEPGALLEPFLSALQQDCKPLASEVEELLKDPTPEKARALLDKLPDLVPNNPMLAPLFAEEMAKAYGDAFTKARSSSAPDDTELANSTDANGNEHAEKGSGNGGQFVSKGEGSSGTPSETTEKSDGTKKEEPKNAETGYTAEHRAKIGQDGDYKSLGLPSLRDITPDEPRAEGKTKIADAKTRITAGETVKSPLGDELTIDERTTEHWRLTNKSDADITERLQHLDEAETTITNPHEIWQGGGKHKGTSYIRVVKSPSGRYVLNVAEMKDGVVSWHMNDTHYDFWRKGTLLYVR